MRLWERIAAMLHRPPPAVPSEPPPPLRIAPLSAPPRRLSDREMERMRAEQRAIRLRIQAAARVIGRALD